jgi:hypothetical protein
MPGDKTMAAQGVSRKPVSIDVYYNAHLVAAFLNPSAIKNLGPTGAIRWLNPRLSVLEDAELERLATFLAEYFCIRDKELDASAMYCAIMDDLRGYREDLRKISMVAHAA